MLEMLIKEGNIPAIQTLLDQGTDPNTILMAAAASNNQNLLEAIAHHPKFSVNNITIQAIWAGIEAGQFHLLPILLNKKTLAPDEREALETLENRVNILAAMDALVIDDPDALMLLEEPGITVTKNMLAEYRRQIHEHYKTDFILMETSRIKKDKNTLPLSVHFINDEPYLVLPTTKEWKNKMERHANDTNLKLIYPKGMISLRTGKIMHVKIFRPAKATDSEPKRLTKIEQFNTKALGLYCDWAQRGTQKGVVCYLYGDYILGTDVSKIIKYSNNVSFLDALTISRLLCNALDEFHKKGFIHFDIKPGNAIYNKKTNQLKLIDFESMKKLHDTDIPLACTFAYSHHTVVNAYKSRRKIKFIPAIDVYSLIITMLELLKTALKHETDNVTRDNISKIRKDLKTSLCVDVNETPLRYEDLDHLPSLKSISLWMDAQHKKYFGNANIANENGNRSSAHVQIQC